MTGAKQMTLHISIWALIGLFYLAATPNAGLLPNAEVHTGGAGYYAPLVPFAARIDIGVFAALILCGAVYGYWARSATFPRALAVTSAFHGLLTAIALLVMTYPDFHHWVVTRDFDPIDRDTRGVVDGVGLFIFGLSAALFVAHIAARLGFRPTNYGRGFNFDYVPEEDEEWRKYGRFDRTDPQLADRQQKKVMAVGRSPRQE